MNKSYSKLFLFCSVLFCSIVILSCVTFVFSSKNSSRTTRTRRNEVYDSLADKIKKAALGVQSNPSLPNDLEKIYQVIEAMNITQTIMSPARYSYNRQHGLYNNKYDMRHQYKLLEGWQGICGNHQAIFLELMKRLDILARPIDFYFDKNSIKLNHAAVEVYLFSKWRYIDVTWGTFWLSDKYDLSSMLSIDEVMSGYGYQLSNSNLWYLTRINMKKPIADPFLYLHSSNTQLIKNKGGKLSLSFDNEKTINFTNIPNYIGKTTADYSPMLFSLKGIKKPVAIDIYINKLGGSCKKHLLSNGRNEIHAKIGVNRVVFHPGKPLSIVCMKQQTCYTVLSKIIVRRNI